MEGNEIGWPLGLGSMTSRIRVVAAATDLAPPPQPAPSRTRRCSSFSSFSSSNLDTESTASFFPDQSVSLGRLIGIKPAAKKGRSEREGINAVPGELIIRCDDDMGKGPPRNCTHNGICSPLLHHVIGRIGRTSSRH